MSELDFEQLLASCHADLKKDYDEAEEFSDWMPDDGEYLVSVLKCSRGTFDKDGKTVFFWKPTVRIESGDNPNLMGQEFALGFFNTLAPGIMKARVKELNGGNPVEFDDIGRVFTSSVGKILRVKVSTTVSKKNGQEYTNCYIQEVMAAQDAADDVSEPPQENQDELTEGGGETPVAEGETLA